MDEQIPAMREPVLVCGNNVEVEKGYLSTYYLDENKNVTYEWNIPEHGYTYNVTHWMPLPKPYKKPGPFSISGDLYLRYNDYTTTVYVGSMLRSECVVLIRELNRLWPREDK